MTDRLALADEITRFLDKHALIAANYDPEYDEPGDRFNGPDSGMMFAAAEGLRMDVEFPMPHSSFHSGCYTPDNDKSVEAWHAEIKTKLREYLHEHYPQNAHRI
jgi:hypothetical protein